MRGVTAAIGASVAAGSITYVVFDVIGAFPFAVRLLVAVAVGIAGLIVARVAYRRQQQPEGGLSVGEGIRASGDITLKDVDVDAARGDTRVGTGWRSRGKARISDVRVRRRPENE